MTTVGVVRERGPVEHRVALVPDTVGKLRAAGLEVVVEPGAGAGAWFTDDDYRAAGATIGAAGQGDVVLCVGPPDPATDLRPGQLLLGLLEPLQHPELVRQRADAGVTAVSLDLAASHPEPGAGDGRADLAGERRRLQGGAARGRGVRRVLPDADDRGRHRPAGGGAGPRRRRGRAAGDRYRAAARRRGHRLRRAARTQGRGAVARRPVPRPVGGGLGRRRGRLRPALDDDERHAQQRAAGGADRPLRRGHHHRAGTRPRPPCW